MLYRRVWAEYRRQSASSLFVSNSLSPACCLQLVVSNLSTTPAGRSIVNSLTLANQPILWVSAIGLATGLTISTQEMLFGWLINRQWPSWPLVWRQFAFSTLSLGAIFGFSSWMLVKLGPTLAAPIASEEMIAFFAKIGLLMAIVTPLSNQIRRFLSARQASASKSSGDFQ